MKKFISIILFAAVALGLSSCKHELDTLVPADAFGFRGNAQVVEVSSFADSLFFSIVKSGLGKTAATVQVVGDPSVVDAYNQANGTDFVALADSYYTVEGKQAKFEAKEVFKTGSVLWKNSEVAQFVKTGKCVIPLKLSCDGSVALTEGRDFLLVHLKPSTASFEKELGARLYLDKAIPSNPVYSYTGSISFDIPVACEGVTISFAKDYTLVDEFNTTLNAKSATPAVAPTVDIVNFPASVVVPKGVASLKVDYTIDVTSLYSGGKACVFFDQWVVPVVMTKTSNENVIIDQKRMFIHLYGPADDGDEPTGTPHDIMGPWVILEGENLSVVGEYGDDLAGMYPEALGCSVDKLVDGDLKTSWWSVWDNEIKFPIVFVFDTGANHIFDMMYLADAPRYQGQYRKYRIYVARTYKGDSTEWVKISEGIKGYDWRDQVNVYDCPVQTKATGRYLKLELVEPSFSLTDNDFIRGRGRLNEFYGHGI